MEASNTSCFIRCFVWRANQRKRKENREGKRERSRGRGRREEEGALLHFSCRFLGLEVHFDQENQG